MLHQSPVLPARCHVALPARRSLLSGGAALLLLPRPAQAEEAGFLELRSAALAYRFRYPTSTPAGVPLSWAVSREPVKYQSAAPLSADSRQRIVTSLAVLSGPLTLSLVVGPPSPAYLEAQTAAGGVLSPTDEVKLLLADRATGRVSSGQRISLAAVEGVRVGEGPEPPIFYEAVSRGGPTAVDAKAVTYRRSAGVVRRRAGYFYTLAYAAPEARFEELRPLLVASLESFELEAPGDEFVDPTDSFALF